MIFDTAAYVIQQHQNDMDQLAERELAARQVSGRSAHELRSQLARTSWPTVLYQSLAATKSASDVELRGAWQEQSGAVDCRQPLDSQAPGLFAEVYERREIDLAPFPFCAFALQFTFTLAQPYISRDEQQFYIIDNPIRKDPVSQLPYMAATSWKGSLRASLWHLGHQKDGAGVQRLFGTSLGSESEELSRSGRLSFFPTYFSRRGLDIINPQDRNLRSGTDPIVFETVPAGTSGNFTLLYVPFDLIGQDESETRRQVSEDLMLVAGGVRAMLCLYGFGAKTGSSFGLARETVRDGALSLRAQLGAIGRPETRPSGSPPEEQLPRYLEAPGRLKVEYRNPDDSFRERAPDEVARMKKSDRQLYERARGWWERQSRERAAATPGEVGVTQAVDEPTPPDIPRVSESDFTTFDQLEERVRLVTKELQDDVR